MKIYISIVTNKKTGVREVRQVTSVKKTAWKFHLDAGEANSISHTEEWDETAIDVFAFNKEYITEEDWGKYP